MFSSCGGQGKSAPQSQGQPGATEDSAVIAGFGTEGEKRQDSGAFAALLSQALQNSSLPDSAYQEISQRVLGSPSFEGDLATVLARPEYLRQLVDPWHKLPDGFAPPDLVALGSGGSYTVSRNGLMLRRAAADSFEEMAKAALADGITLVASSTYRSYDYQVEVHERYAREYGRQEAERFSAKPGYSQHQTGLVIDFGTIDNTFAASPAGLWMEKNASAFGWSLSFPDGTEDITGYTWESWHFRYVGKELAAFIDNYFGGMQQFALRFIYEWEHLQA